MDAKQTYLATLFVGCLAAWLPCVSRAQCTSGAAAANVTCSLHMIRADCPLLDVTSFQFWKWFFDPCPKTAKFGMANLANNNLFVWNKSSATDRIPSLFFMVPSDPGSYVDLYVGVTVAGKWPCVWRFCHDSKWFPSCRLKVVPTACPPGTSALTTRAVIRTTTGRRTVPSSSPAAISTRTPVGGASPSRADLSTTISTASSHPTSITTMRANTNADHVVRPGLGVGYAVAIALGCLIVILISAMTIFCIRKKRKKKNRLHGSVAGDQRAVELPTVLSATELPTELPTVLAAGELQRGASNGAIDKPEVAAAAGASTSDDVAGIDITLAGVVETAGALGNILSEHTQDQLGHAIVKLCCAGRGEPDNYRTILSSYNAQNGTSGLEGSLRFWLKKQNDHHGQDIFHIIHAIDVNEARHCRPKLGLPLAQTGDTDERTRPPSGGGK